MPKLYQKRGTRAQLDAAKAANQLNAGEIYVITDENRLAVGLSANTYQDFDKEPLVTTWANKPAGNTLTPYVDKVFITDVGVGGSEWYWDGSRYRVVGGSTVLATRNASNSATVNTTTETKLISYAIPAGVIQSGDTIKIEAKIVRTSVLTEAIAINQFYQLHNTDSFQASPASQQNASLISGNVASYEFFEYRCVNNTTIKQLSAVTGTGYGTGGATNQPDRTVSDLSTNIIYAGVYARYASTPTGAANCDFFRVTLNTNN